MQLQVLNDVHLSITVNRCVVPGGWFFLTSMELLRGNNRTLLVSKHNRGSLQQRKPQRFCATKQGVTGSRVPSIPDCTF